MSESMQEDTTWRIEIGYVNMCILMPSWYKNESIIQDQSHPFKYNVIVQMYSALFICSGPNTSPIIAK